MGAQTKWLDHDQQTTWRAFVIGAQMLLDRLDRDLRLEHGISLAEYEILVRLSESPSHRMRMALLADALCHSRSRVTHTVARMERSGLLDRSQSADDGRGVEAVMSQAGSELLEQAAPSHVDGVRRNLVEVASAEDFEALGRVMNEVADRLLAGKPPSADLRLPPQEEPARARGRAGAGPPQSRVSRRWVTRCGRAASTPRRSTLFCSYAA